MPDFMVLLEGFGLVGGLEESQSIPNLGKFRRELGEYIKRDQDTFKQTLEDYMSNGEHLALLLHPLSLPRGESILRVLLNTETVQPIVFDLILDGVPTFNDPTLTAKVLKTLRWLNFLTNSAAATEKLLESIESISDLDMKKELLSMVPDILDPLDHPSAAQRLIEMLDEDDSLLVAVVDALSTMELEATQLEKVLRLVLEKLSSSSEEDLPIAIKFLLQNATPKIEKQVMAELRQQLPLSTQQEQKYNKQTTGLIVDALKESIRVKNKLIAVFLNDMSSSKSTNMTDIIMCIVIYSLDERKSRKAVEQQLFKKILSGHPLFATVILRTIAVHHPVLSGYFETITAMATLMLKNGNDVIIYNCGKQLMLDLYKHFPEGSYRHLLVDTQLDLVSCRQATEVDAGLDVLLDLVRYNLQEMRSSSSLLMVILDEILVMTIPQVEKVYQLFAMLAFAKRPTESSLYNEMFIMVNKQLTHHDAHIRRIGCIGLASIIAAADRPANPDDVKAENELFEINEQLKEEIKDRLTSAQAFKQTSNVVYWYDELSRIVLTTRIDCDVLRCYAELLDELFAETYLKDYTDGSKTQQQSKEQEDEDAQQLTADNVDFHTKKFMHQIGSDAEVAVVISGGGTSCEFGWERWGLCGLFRLMQATKTQLEPSDGLSGYAPMLTIPLYANNLKALKWWKNENEQEIYYFPMLDQHEKEQAITTVIVVINWFTELVNAFAGHDDEAVCVNVQKRLRKMAFLEERLDRAITQCPSFTIQRFQTMMGLSELPDQYCRAPQKVPTMPLGFGRKKATQSSPTKPLKQESTTKGDDEGGSTTVINVEGKGYDATPDRPNLAKFSPVIRRFLDSTIDTLSWFVKENTCFQWAELHIILRDVDHKLTQSMTALHSGNGYKRRVLKQLPSICILLDKLCADVQTTGDQPLKQHGVTDIGYAASCLKLMFSIFSTLLDKKATPLKILNKQLETQLEQLNASYTEELDDRNSERSKMKEDQLSLPTQREFELHILSVMDTMTQQKKCSIGVPLMKYFVSKLCRIPQLEAALQCLKVQAHICQQDPSLTRCLSSNAKTLLRMDWTQGRPNSTTFRKLVKEQDVKDALKIYVQHAENKTKTLGRVVQLVTDTFNGIEAGDWQTITKHTFPWYYKILLELCAALPQSPSTTTLSTSQAESTTIDSQTFFKEVQEKIRLFGTLASIAKHNARKTILTPILRHSKGLFEKFLKISPYLRNKCNHGNTQVAALCKIIHKLTPTVQHICDHIGEQKLQQLLALVPGLRKQMEEITLQTSQLLTLNKWEEFCQMGHVERKKIGHGRKKRKRTETKEKKTARRPSKIKKIGPSAPRDDEEEEEDDEI